MNFTCDRSDFLGFDKGLKAPKALREKNLKGVFGSVLDSCLVIQSKIKLNAGERKELVVLLGEEDVLEDIENKINKYSNMNNVDEALEDIKAYWKKFLGAIQVKTSNKSMDYLLNGWLLYQTLCSRLYGRTGFYQSGGAYGFRDQLQDTMSLKYVDSDITKNQIIRNSCHQFIEGDVLHWWHEETGRGIRTKFSDDLVWLAYVTYDYIKFTNDYGILDIETNYLIGEELKDGENERYDLFKKSDIKEPIYNHCIKAIKKACNFGENGLPKIGSGDWNDGFSNVGTKGKGESVWLGFFQYAILDKFIPICNKMGDEELAKKYEDIKINLKKALNTKAWDGRWFRRAFMDDGNVLGSMENDECRIDSIAQSWSVISGAGDNDKKYISMESLENHLVDREHGLIKLLDPPFEKGKLEPGYIKAYLPGVRENGGQYTHSAIWVIIAETMLGFGDKATELYRMINPIEHARTKEASKKYKVEPYVIAADVYGASNLAGQGGWTWYTGSSSWYYKAGIEYILGLKIEKGYMKIEPCIPKEWKEYQIQYKWKESIYNIRIKNSNGKNMGVSEIKLNGEKIENYIKLDGSRNIYQIEVTM